MSARVTLFRIGLVCALLALLPGRALADSPLRVEAGVTAHKTGDSLDTPGFVLGGALALTRWTPLESLAFVPQLEVLLARRNASVALGGAENTAYSMDVIELSLLLRSELILGSRSYYVLAGGYGSVLLRAQSTDAGIVDGADTANRLDVGFLAGGGFELAAFAGGELFIEARWQRGHRELLPGNGAQEALSLLLGYGLDTDTGDSLSRAQDRRLALKGGLVATRWRSQAFAATSYSPGFALGGAFSPARVGSRIALVPQLEWAFVHRSAHAGGPAAGSLALDSIDLSMIARGELMLARHSLYGVAGVYGSALLRAQRIREGVTTDVRDAVSSVDAGWLAGAGIELAANASARLSLELRYQRGVRDLFPTDPDDVTGQSVSFLFGIVHGSAPFPRSGASRPDDEPPPSESIAALDAIEAKVARLITAMEAASTPRWKRRGTCPSGAVMPAAAGVFASPDECAIDDAQQETRDALRTVTLSLTRDLSDLVARLRFLAREEYGEYPWGTISGTLIHETVEHVLWMTDALQAAQELLELADVEPHDDSSWQEAGRRYEAALLGAQVLAVWVSWLDVSRSLTVDTALDVELIAVRMGNAWREMAPVLAQLQHGHIQEAAHTLESELPAWSDALYAWGKEAEHALREGDKLVRTLLLIQAVFDVATTRHVMKPLIGRATSFAFVLPGIGGVTAGGAATGVRVVISAEWIKAMQHLVAIGAISTIEIARIAGVSSLVEPVPGPVMPSALQKDDSGASVPSTAGQQRPVQVVVQHKGGNQQVVVNGQRWHVPKGKSASDIPAADPVGDRLQAEVNKIAREWNPGKLSPREQNAIDQAQAAGKPWLARLLEREARGRWVEREARIKITDLKWSRRGVDALDRRTGIKYEVLSGTRDNLNDHAKRMSGEIFRMITF